VLVGWILQNLETGGSMSGLALFTLLHVALSLVGIAAGFVVVFGLIGGKKLGVWTPTFVWTTILTSVTGFLFPFKGVTPGIVLGIISLVVLAFTVYALYMKHLAGAWRSTYAVTAVLALYLNFFVLIAQMFMKVPALKALAPTGTEGPFKVTQLCALILFLVLGFLATRRFRHTELSAA
jgi:hypothetical protein